MQHYYGMKAIAKRLDISPNTVNRWIDGYGLPVYLRVDKRCKYRRMLYTNEELLSRWEHTMCAEYRLRRIGSKTVVGPQRVLRPSAEEIKRRMKSDKYQQNSTDNGQISADSTP